MTSVWMDAYNELDELMRLYMEKKISRQEFNARKSVIDERMKAARQKMHEIIKDANANDKK
jgi:hypothetical protein